VITIYARWEKTTAINVKTNTATKFEAVLKDNLGKFKAVVTRNADNTVDVLFDGAPKRLSLKLDYAQWEFSAIWADLDAQGHKVLALT
jgi:hypothetical protein